MSAINRGRFLPRFPASVQSTGPIITTQAALTYTFSFDLRGLGVESSSIDRAAHVTLVQNSTTGGFSQIALDDLLSGNQPLDATLTALAALDSSTGLLEQTGADTFAKRSMGTGASTSIPTLADADGRYQPLGNYQPLDADLTAVAGLSSAGLLARTGAGTAAARTLTGSAGRVTVTNGDGVSGNPTIDWDGVQVRKNSAGSTFTRRRVNLIEGSNVTLTVADDSGSDEVDVTIAAATSTTFPNGTVIGGVSGTYATNADITAVIPADDTIPQNTEGTQIISVSFAPSSTTSRLRATFAAFGAHTGTGNMTAALFVNSTANALAAAVTSSPAANYFVPFFFQHEWVPGSTSSQTINLRVGTSSGTMRLNGSTSARLFGGVAAATLIIEEIKA